MSQSVWDETVSLTQFSLTTPPLKPVPKNINITLSRIPNIAEKSDQKTDIKDNTKRKRLVWIICGLMIILVIVGLGVGGALIATIGFRNNQSISSTIDTATAFVMNQSTTGTTTTSATGNISSSTGLNTISTVVSISTNTIATTIASSSSSISTALLTTITTTTSTISTTSTTQTTSSSTSTTTTSAPVPTCAPQSATIGTLFSIANPISSSYPNYTCYAYTLAAKASSSTLSFFFRHDTGGWLLDDVSVYHGSTQMIINGRFENGNLNGWTYSGTCSSSGGQTNMGSGSANSGNYYYYDPCAGTGDMISQTFPTVYGDTYVISFWLTNFQCCNSTQLVTVDFS